MISITINGRHHSVAKDTTILDACRYCHVFVPTLCYHPDLPPSGKCGLCVVKVDENSYAYACMQKVRPGMIIETNSQDVLEKVKRSYTNFIDMPVVPPSKDLEEICNYLYPRNAVRTREFDSTNSLTFIPENCINCGRCVRMCSDIQNIGALNDSNPRMRQNECISCGQCIPVCPTPALTETSSIPSILRAIVNQKILIMQLAPSVRVSVAELFNEPIGTICTGKIISAARKIGFKYIFDTNFGADVTIVEEGTELLNRLNNKGVLPQFTSCCPAWVNYVEKIHTELIPNLSTTKSPHMIVGSLIRTYFAQKMKIDEQNIFIVSLMPCVAKKDEIKRMQMIGDVDSVITTNEFSQLLNQFGIEWSSLKNSDFDDLLGEASGGGAIFGVTGGVAESSCRFIHEKLTNQPLGSVEYKQLRGLKSVKSANIKLGDKNIKIAVCSGIGPAIDLIESEEYRQFHFIEVMACPSGCISGPGQPRLSSRLDAQKRIDSIYRIDKESKEKVCSKNPKVKELYKSYIGEPNGKRAEELLHTHFEPHETVQLAKRRRMQKMPIVAYGSASGTAMKLARIVAGSIGSSSVAINSLSVGAMLKRRTAIFIISTIGDGEFPTNSRKFIEELRNSFDDLSTVEFAVVGLGSRSFKQFCVAGRQLSLLLEQHLGKPLLPFTEIDTSVDDKGEAVFEKWTFALCAALKLKPPRIGIKLIFRLIPEEDSSVIKNPYRPVSFEFATIKSKTFLTSEGYEKEMVMYTIKLPRGVGYDAGNYLGILPENPKEIVNEVIQALELDPNQVYRLVVSEMTNDNYLPERASVYQLFAQYLDLSGVPNRSIMRAFLQVANKEGQDKISKYLDVNDESHFKEMIKDITTGKFVIEHVKYGIPDINLIVSSFPHIQPRWYSIASSPHQEAGTCKLIITNVYFGENQKRKGLCTSFLSRPDVSNIAIKISEGAFAYPEEKNTPMIMVALGCGIAPVYSLIEHKKNMNNTGPAILFYGCRNKAGYQNMIDLLEAEKKSGVIDNIYYSISRDDPKKKNYVTDEMLLHFEELWKYWQDPKAQFFYCGPAGNIPDHLKEIMLKVTMEVGGLSSEEASVFNLRHSYLVEAFS